MGRKKLNFIIVLLLFIGASSALAINFGLTGFWAQVFEYTGYAGSGADGDLTLSGITNGTSNPYLVNTTKTRLNLDATQGTTTLNVVSSTGFTSGDEVLLIQMMGSNAGTYEFATIATVVNGTQMTISAGTENHYYSGASFITQVIKVPRYNNVTINSGAQLSVSSWNGTLGGVLVMKVAGILDIHDGGGGTPGRITVGAGNNVLTPRGFAGGTSGSPADSAFLLDTGDPNSSDSKAVSPGSHARLIMGSGGAGATTGHPGAGVIIVKANEIRLGGQIDATTQIFGVANQVPGAGGAILVVANNLNKGSYTNCGSITAAGGRTSTMNWSDNGRVFVHYESSLGSGCEGAAAPADISTVRKLYLK